MIIETPSGVMVTMQDVRLAAYCRSGCRAWATHHGLSWPDFVNEGLPVEVFIALNDGFGNVLVLSALKRAGQESPRG